MAFFLIRNLDKEASKIILKWDGDSDFDDHLEEVLFSFKKDFILLTHPKLIQKKIDSFVQILEAIGLSQKSEPETRSKLDFPEIEHYNLLDLYNKLESLKAHLKLNIQSETDELKLHGLLLNYQDLYLGWYKVLSGIKLVDVDYSDVKQAKEPNPIDLLNDIKSWSDDKYASELIQKTNFAILYNEICRSKLILEQL